jgi:hypothetical protein
MHTADRGYAAARPSCMPSTRCIMPASVHAETSIISLLASSIFVPDGFLKSNSSNRGCPRALRPENTTYSSALPCCARALVLPSTYPSAIVSCLSRSLTPYTSKATARTELVHTPNFHADAGAHYACSRLPSTSPPILRLQLGGVK